MRYTERTTDSLATDGPLRPDPVIEACKKDVDRTLLVESLRRTPAQRLQRLQEFMTTVSRLRGAARRRP